MHVHHLSPPLVPCTSVHHLSPPLVPCTCTTFHLLWSHARQCTTFHLLWSHAPPLVQCTCTTFHLLWCTNFHLLWSHARQCTTFHLLWSHAHAPPFTSFGPMHVHHLSPPLVPRTNFHFGQCTTFHLLWSHAHAPPFTSFGPMHVHHLSPPLVPRKSVHHLSPPLVPCTCTTFHLLWSHARQCTTFHLLWSHARAPSPPPLSSHCFTSFATTHMHGHLFPLKTLFHFLDLRGHSFVPCNVGPSGLPAIDSGSQRSEQTPVYGSFLPCRLKRRRQITRCVRASRSASVPNASTVQALLGKRKRRRAGTEVVLGEEEGGGGAPSHKRYFCCCTELPTSPPKIPRSNKEDHGARWHNRALRTGCQVMTEPERTIISYTHDTGTLQDTRGSDLSSRQ